MNNKNIILSVHGVEKHGELDSKLARSFMLPDSEDDLVWGCSVELLDEDNVYIGGI